jgi:hypothetical protein
VAPTTAMMAIVVEIMVEMLSILAIATKEIKQKRASGLITSKQFVTLDLRLF